MKRIGQNLISGILIIFFMGGALLFAQNSALESVPTDEVTQESLKFSRIYEDLQQNYANAPDPDRLILEGAVRGMLSSLDPFSSFFDRDQFEQLQQQTRGEVLGFGAI